MSLLVCDSLAAQKKKSPPLPITSSPIDYSIPLIADGWNLPADKAEFFEKNGIRFMRIKAGNQGPVSPKNTSFTSGTIEFDFEPANPMTLGSSPTVYFRGNTEANDVEIFYIRARPGNPRSNDAIQYCPILAGVNMWDMYPQYQGHAFFEADKPNHLKLIINGSQMQVFLNDMNKPALHIPKLEGRGNGTSIAFDGGMLVSNLFIKPNIVEDLPAFAAPDLTEHDANYIRLWQHTSVSDLSIGNEVYTLNLPKAEAYVETIAAETYGLINLSRKFGNNQSRKVIYLKAKIKSEQQQKINMQLGFSDEVWVFLNNQMIFVDKNLFLQAPMRKYPDGRISTLNSKMSLPLKAGENELVIAVANDFYGWGIIARLENMEGVHF
ncbi:MAG: hypothetical protein KA143_04080 [Saprospiraceae bacterium]|nr:hypothetical protein [Saprospiraceae bacterium]